MRFLMTTTAADPPDEKLETEMARLVEEMTRKGVLLAAGGLDPVGTRVTASGGKITVTDGPFTTCVCVTSVCIVADDPACTGRAPVTTAGPRPR